MTEALYKPPEPCHHKRLNDDLICLFRETKRLFLEDPEGFVSGSLAAIALYSLVGIDNILRKSQSVVESFRLPTSKN